MDLPEITAAIERDVAKQNAINSYKSLETIGGPNDVPTLGGLTDLDGRALRKVIQNTITTKNLEIAQLKAENIELKRRLEEIGGTRKRKKVTVKPNERFVDILQIQEAQRAAREAEKAEEDKENRPLSSIKLRLRFT
jgi:hypothetical protein